jgi:hypothetical protein
MIGAYKWRYSEVIDDLYDDVRVLTDAGNEIGERCEQPINLPSQKRCGLGRRIRKNQPFNSINLRDSAACIGIVRNYCALRANYADLSPSNRLRLGKGTRAC